MADDPTSAEAGPSNLYKTLTEVRRGLHEYAYPAYDDTEQHLPVSAVLHPLHGRKPSRQGQSKRHEALSQSAIRQAIAEARSTLQTFRASLQGDEELSAQGRAGDAAAARLRLSKQQRLASLLREQSTHAIASADTAGKISSADSVYRDVNQGKLRHLPECMAMGALRSSATNANQSQSWPTTDQTQASEGLKSFVNALETLSTTTLGLEAFSEERPVAEGVPSTYTLAMAAKIIVIDLEFALQQQRAGEIVDAWHPKLKARVSFATDSSAENGHAAVRDGKLGDLILEDVQRLADCIFGIEAGTSEGQGQQHVVSTAQRVISRLLCNIDILHRLDDLSQRYTIPQHPDLFTALESASQAIARAQQSDPTQKDEPDSFRPHEGTPYITCRILQTNTADSEASEGSADVSSRRADYALRVSLMPWRRACLRDESADLPSLVGDTDANIEEVLQYTALIEPPIAMPASAARSLMQACGMLSKDDKTIAKGKERRVIGFAALLHSGTLTAKDEASSGPDVAVNNDTEEVILVSRFPFASSAQLFAAVRILKAHARVAELMHSLPLSAIDDVTTDGTSSTVHTSIASDDGTSHSATASFTLDHSTEHWRVRATRADAASGSLEEEEAARLSQAFNEGGVPQLSKVLASLEQWAKDSQVASKDQMDVVPEEQPSVRRTKRRRSSSTHEQPS